MRKLLLILCFSILIAFSMKYAAFAAIYYVAGDVGSDTNTAVEAQSTETPWATIQKPLILWLQVILLM